MIKVKSEQTFKSRTGTAYTIGKVTDRNFEVIKETGKSVKVSFKMVSNTEERLKAGEKLNFQQNQVHGGISYTVAIESGVVYALSDIITINNSNRTYHI